jgi:two-component sensor histidine kinase
MSALGRIETERLPPVLIAAHRRANFDVLRAAVEEAGLAARVVDACSQLPEQAESAACLVLAQETLTPELVLAVERTLGAQPTWSQLPVIVLSEFGALDRALREALAAEWRGAQVTLLARPLKVGDFQSAIQFALAARLRQFALRDQLVQEQELRRELDHRVKNILATVQAMASMTRRMAKDDAEAFGEFESRLTALAAVHESLHAAADDGLTFEQLAQSALGPYMRDGSRRFLIAGGAGALQPEAAKTLGLCLYELATNALKYGALSTAGGGVEVSLERDDDRSRFRWIERGGPRVEPPRRVGYGARFVQASLGALFGSTVEAEYDPSGLRLGASGGAEGLWRVAPDDAAAEGQPSAA